MKRVWWAIPFVATAAVVIVAGRSLPMIGRGALLAAGALTAAFAPPAAVLAIPFLLVQVFGEAFQIGGPLAVSQLSFALVLVAVVRATRHGFPAGPGPLDRALAAWFVVVTAFTLVGFAGGASGPAIKEDLVPIVMLGITYVCVRLIVRGPRDVRTIELLLLCGSAVAASKVAFLMVASVPVSWNSQWQAARVGGVLTRVVLRGGDVFFVVTSLLVLARVVAGRAVRVPEAAVGFLSLVAVVVAATRSNWVGWLVGALVIVGVGLLARTTRPRRVALLITASALISLVAVASFPVIWQWVVALSAVSVSRTYTLDFRVFETAGILSAIADDGWLGGGFGRLYTHWNVDFQSFTTTTWSHNAYLQIWLKAGPIGLATFLFLVGRAVVTALGRCLRRTSDHARVLGWAGAIVAVLVVSLTSNRVFVLSGAMFLGLALALVESGASERAR
jgi:hypothetical protein